MACCGLKSDFVGQGNKTGTGTQTHKAMGSPSTEATTRAGSGEPLLNS